MREIEQKMRIQNALKTSFTPVSRQMGPGVEKVYEAVPEKPALPQPSIIPSLSLSTAEKMNAEYNLETKEMRDVIAEHEAAPERIARLKDELVKTQLIQKTMPGARSKIAKLKNDIENTEMQILDPDELQRLKTEIRIRESGE